MKIVTKKIHKNTKGDGDLIDITTDLIDLLSALDMSEGQAAVFVIGSTAGITCFEYEPGLIQDMQNVYEKLAPKNQYYKHHETWNDGNGFSHVRSALQGSTITIPFEHKKFFLGTWQQVVLAEFDNRPREREIVVQFLGQ